MNLPNLLSIFRFFCTFLFIAFTSRELYKEAFIVFLLMGLSDFFDGLLARVFRWKTAIGAFLDPLADKFMLISAYVILALRDLVPQWMTLTVLLRDSVVLSGFFVFSKYFGHTIPRPRVLGKVSNATQIIQIAYVLYSPDGVLKSHFLYLAFFFTVSSGLDYLYLGFRTIFRYGPARS